MIKKSLNVSVQKIFYLFFSCGVENQNKYQKSYIYDSSDWNRSDRILKLCFLNASLDVCCLDFYTLDLLVRWIMSRSDKCQPSINKQSHSFSLFPSVYYHRAVSTRIGLRFSGWKEKDPVEWIISAVYRERSWCQPDRVGLHTGLRIHTQSHRLFKFGRVNVKSMVHPCQRLFVWVSLAQKWNKTHISRLKENRMQLNLVFFSTNLHGWVYWFDIPEV